MGETPVRVLLVDADRDSLAKVHAMLNAHSAPSFCVDSAITVAEAGTLAASTSYDTVLLNLSSCQPSGLAGLALLQALAPSAAIVVMATESEETTALKALQVGALDYLLTEQIYDTLLVRAIRHAQQRNRAERDRLDAEQALRVSERRYRALFEQSRDAIFITDPAGRITEANVAAVDMLGLALDELRERPLVSLLYDVRDYEALERELHEKAYARDMEVRVRRADGAVRWCILSAAIRVSDDGVTRGFQGILHDITDRKQAEERLLHEAFHDPLTGLPNRALFTDRLQVAMARWRRSPEFGYAVMFLDLDRFKVVNDSLGHAVGDALLTHVAQAVASCLRAQDTVARLGGDEFAILLENISGPADAVHAAHRVHAALADPFELDGHRLFTSASVGIAFPHAQDQRPEELLRNADIAMYRAKAAGPSRFEIFTPSMHDSAIGRLELETDLRLAVGREEFIVHYQPILALPEQRIVGLEALVRWRHPRRGLLMPGDFIAVAEETGMIVPIGWWVLKEACARGRHLMQVTQPGMCPYVAVNLSSRQLALEDLAEQVIAILIETGLPPSLLSLEITESSLITSGSAVDNLSRLRAAGVHVCIDDFGTGYSSLAYLHSLPVDGLKIDRSFVRRLGSTSDRSELVQTILGLAARLGITTVVEGVETNEQLEHLQRLGPACAQGFLFSRPLEENAVTTLLAEQAFHVPRQFDVLLH